jgi:hypothetical protein
MVRFNHSRQLDGPGSESIRGAIEVDLDGSRIVDSDVAIGRTSGIRLERQG